MRRIIAATILAATATIGALTAVSAAGGMLAYASPDAVNCCHPH
jgi:hypothetical protein